MPMSAFRFISVIWATCWSGFQAALSSHAWIALTGVGTLAMAWTAYLNIRRDSKKESRKYTPLMTFDFHDTPDAQHENLGPPGFRNIESNPVHPALLVSGTLRNISGTPSVDCKFDIYHCGESLGNAIHEISDVTLHSGLGSGENVELSKTITLNDIDTRGSTYFSVGIAGLFSIGEVQPGSEYPFFVVFSYKNISW